MPKVYNKCDKSIPEGAVYVGRPSFWGNPFKIGDAYYQKDKMTRTDAIEAYIEWLQTSDEGAKRLARIRDLRGKNLVCWCAPQACHADILLELANS